MRYIVFIGWFLALTANQALAQEGYDHLRSNEIRVVNGKSYFVHRVKKGQTLYSISKAYAVEMQEIIDTNPEIRKGLKANQTLLIPAPEQKEVYDLPHLEDIPVMEPSPEETLSLQHFLSFPPPAGSISSQLPCGMHPESVKEVYNVALMMHFFLSEADSIRTESPTQEEIESYNSFRYIQFYEGFLLAVDSLKKEGLSLNLYVYDVNTDPSATYAVLRNPEMAGMDLIIGMLFNRNFQIVANWALEHKIPVISPVSERESQVEGNPMVIKVRPSGSSEGIALAEYLSQHYPYAHTLVTRSWEPEVRKMADQIFANCKALGMDVSVVEDEELIARLHPAAENLVVVLSTQKPFVLNILSHLNADALGYRFTVFGLPRWDQIEGMDYEYLEKARAHVLVPSWIDYADPAVRRFIDRFRGSYKTEPEPLAFQGYDAAWYFLSALKRYGTGFQECLREITITPLQTVYKFRQQNGDGWENNHWEMFRYEDYARIPMN